MDRLRTDTRLALLAFALIMLAMLIAGYIGYDRWWIERYY